MLSKHSDVALALGVVGVLLVLIVPVPTALLDGYAVKVLELCPDGVECDIDRDGWGALPPS